jgi:predicted AAA+ superfamily ATPase
MLAREAEEEFREILLKNKSKNVILLEGARQVGKTSILNNILKKSKGVVYINFETEKLVSV